MSFGVPLLLLCLLAVPVAAAVATGAAPTVCVNGSAASNAASATDRRIWRSGWRFMTYLQCVRTEAERSESSSSSSARICAT